MRSYRSAYTVWCAAPRRGVIFGVVVDSNWTEEGFAVNQIRFDMVKNGCDGRAWKCSNEMNSEGMGVIVDLFGKVWGAPRLGRGRFGLVGGSKNTISIPTAE